MAPLAERLPPGLRVQWLGTAGFRFSYGGYDLVIDPYVTRPGVRNVLGGSPIAPDATLVAEHIPRADAVLVGHTHFDHALDVAALCRLYGCTAYGSASLVRLLGFLGAPQLVKQVVPHKVLSLGPFEVTFVPSRHSPLLLGLGVPYDGELTCDHLDHLRGRDFRCGQVYGIHIAVAGMSFYHQGSAELLDEQVRHKGVDVLLACIAGRGFAPSYLSRVVRALEPGVVVAHHHDNFFLPLDAPMGFSFNVNFGAFLDEVRAVSRDLEVRAFSPLQWIGRDA